MITQGWKPDYGRAAEMVALAAECLDLAEGQGAGDAYVEEVRNGHRRRRNFMKALDERFAGA
ncbi:hypothetical protein [Salininema proteolyticum]|uniref:Uncharacterized protein n=1 Tax=Salininema proteolyticum TaxID=1607685 RepID=A0ABV8U2N7_9ACTN